MADVRPDRAYRLQEPALTVSIGGSMNRDEVAIATMTLARDAEEQRLLREALLVLASLGIPIYVTDGGSGEEFVSDLRRIPNATVCEATSDGLWPQTRRSLEAATASGARFVLYTEPDKRDFFQHGVGALIAQANSDSSAGVVLASRSRTAYSTFPVFQQYTESVINRCCTEVTRHAFDFSYGPFILNSAIVPKLRVLEGRIAWGWRTFTFGLARTLGLRLDQLEVGSPCPRAQRDDEERGYRMLQLAQSVEGAALAARIKLEV